MHIKKIFINDDNNNQICILEMIDNSIKEGRQLYPVKDILHITTSGSAIKCITIIDILGKVILTDDGIESEKNISVRNLPKNTYILKVETLQGQSVNKFNKH